MIAELVEKTCQFRRFHKTPGKVPEHDLDENPVVTSEIFRFTNTDQNGHASDAVLSALCQNAWMDLLNDLTWIVIPACRLLPIVRLHLEYRAELRSPRTLEISTFFDHASCSSIGLDQVVLDQRHCVANAPSAFVPINKDTRCRAPLPPEMIKLIQLLFSEDSEAGRRKTSFAWFVRNDAS